MTPGDYYFLLDFFDFFIRIRIAAIGVKLQCTARKYKYMIMHLTLRKTYWYISSRIKGNR